MVLFFVSVIVRSILRNFLKQLFTKKVSSSPEAVVRRCSVKKMFLEILRNSKETPVPEILFWQKCNFGKKETLAQLFSCEFCKISKNTLFYWTPPVPASFSLKILQTNGSMATVTDKLLKRFTFNFIYSV